MFEKAYVEQFATYRSYWRDDPQFDSANTLAALPDKPCPAMTDEVLTRLCEYAVDAQFGWPRKLAPPLEFSAGDWLRRRLRADAPDGAVRPCKSLGLIVTGSGGGCWTVLDDAHGGLLYREGRAAADTEARMNSRTFRDMVEGTTALDQSLRQARILVRGDRNGLAFLQALVGDSASRHCDQPHSQDAYGEAWEKNEPTMTSD
jgi:hypothetical protein